MYIPIVSNLISKLSNLFESIQSLLIGDRQPDEGNNPIEGLLLGDGDGDLAHILQNIMINDVPQRVQESVLRSNPQDGDIDAPQQGFVTDELLRTFIAETAAGDIYIVKNALIADNIQNEQAPLETLAQDYSEDDVEALVGLLM